MAQAQSCANHMQHMEYFHVQHVMLHAMWYEETAQLLSFTEFKLHLFELYLLAEPLTNEGGEETEEPRENPWRRVSEMNRSCKGL